MSNQGTAEKTLHPDEFALGVLGVIFSVGFLKANEVFDFFDKIDVFKIQGFTLVVHFREFLALLLFSAAYIGFLIAAFFGIQSIVSHQSHAERAGTFRAMGRVMILLLVAQGFAFFGAFSHAMHKYSDESQTTTQQQWDLQR